MKTIDADIRSGNFAPVYLLYGEEDYLKKQYRDKLRHALIFDGDDMNFSAYEGKDALASEIIGMAETLPFFADRRVVLIENSGFFKNGNEELADYMKAIPPTTHVLFVESEIDKRGRLFKGVKEAGRIVEFSRQTEAILSKWVLARLKREEKKITPFALSQFLLSAGNDMEYVDKELEKLLCFCLNKEAIEEQDVENICVHPAENKIFDMINALAEKKRERALAYYYDLLALKEPPMRILFLIARQFRILMLAKEMSGKGYDSRSIAKGAGIPDFAVRKNLAQARSFTTEQLKEAVTECVETETAVKMGNLNDRLGVEILLVKYSSR